MACFAVAEKTTASLRLLTSQRRAATQLIRALRVEEALAAAMAEAALPEVTVAVADAEAVNY